MIPVAVANPFALPFIPSPTADLWVEHLPGMRELADHFLKRANIRGQNPSQKHALQTAAQACAAFQCDPWNFEPLLIEELREAIQKEDTNRIQSLRGLLRAGSWWTHHRIRNADDALRDLDRIWLSHPPTHAQEKTIFRDLLKSHATGLTLDPLARSLETILFSTWTEWQRAQATQSHTESKLLKDDLEEQRSIRNYVYLRLLYPKLAKLGDQK